MTKTVTWRWEENEPFGNSLANADPDGDGVKFKYNLRFPGQYFDVETGLHYNYFRDYDPSTGRYMQSDPIGLAGGLNTYGYVGGNPLRWVDPTGLSKWKWTDEWTDIGKCTENDNECERLIGSGEKKKKGKQSLEQKMLDKICKEHKVNRYDFGDYFETEWKKAMNIMETIRYPGKS